MARKHFSPGAHPAAETPFYIAAASVSARGDGQCVWSHESSISSSYERKHGSARSHIFTSVKTRRVKLVKLETNYTQKEKQSIAKLTRRPQFLQSTLAQLSSVQDGSAQLGSVKVGSREWLSQLALCKLALHESARLNVLCTNCAARFITKVVCASCIVPGCCAQVALCKLLHASALCKLLCASALSKLLCASALRRLLRASALRMCSVQVGLCKLVCASCSAQVLCASALCKFLRKLLCASDSAQVALRKCCRSCGNVLRVLFLTEKLRFSSRSCGSVLRVLRLYLKVAIFQPELRERAPHATIFQPKLQEHAPRTTFVLKSCDFQAGAAADQGRIEPATAELRKQARKPRDNFQRPFREKQNRTAPQRERFDTHDLRRGFAETKKNSHGATARALRHARSPQRVHPGMSKTPRPRRSLQRVHPGMSKTQKTLEFLHLGHADPRRGSRAHRQKRKNNSSFCTSTAPIPAEGRIPDRRVAFPIVGNIPTPRQERDS